MAHCETVQRLSVFREEMASFLHFLGSQARILEARAVLQTFCCRWRRQWRGLVCTSRLETNRHMVASGGNLASSLFSPPPRHDRCILLSLARGWLMLVAGCGEPKTWGRSGFFECGLYVLLAYCPNSNRLVLLRIVAPLPALLSRWSRARC
jgi:hypothetical protein